MLKMLKENTVVSMIFLIVFAGTAYFTKIEYFASYAIATLSTVLSCVFLNMLIKRKYSIVSNFTSYSFFFLVVVLLMYGGLASYFISIVLSIALLFAAVLAMTYISTITAESHFEDDPFWKLYISAFPLLGLFIGWPIYFWSRRTKTVG